MSLNFPQLLLTLEGALAPQAEADQASNKPKPSPSPASSEGKAVISATPEAPKPSSPALAQSITARPQYPSRPTPLTVGEATALSPEAKDLKDTVKAIFGAIKRLELVGNDSPVGDMIPGNYEGQSVVRRMEIAPRGGAQGGYLEVLPGTTASLYLLLAKNAKGKLVVAKGANCYEDGGVYFHNKQVDSLTGRQGLLIDGFTLQEAPEEIILGKDPFEDPNPVTRVRVNRSALTYQNICEEKQDLGFFYTPPDYVAPRGRDFMPYFHIRTRERPKSEAAKNRGELQELKKAQREELRQLRRSGASRGEIKTLRAKHKEAIAELKDRQEAQAQGRDEGSLWIDSKIKAQLEARPYLQGRPELPKPEASSTMLAGASTIQSNTQGAELWAWNLMASVFPEALFRKYGLAPGAMPRDPQKWFDAFGAFFDDDLLTELVETSWSYSSNTQDRFGNPLPPEESLGEFTDYSGSQQRGNLEKFNKTPGHRLASWNLKIEFDDTPLPIPGMGTFAFREGSKIAGAEIITKPVKVPGGG
ncbi:MAG: hypothetical protein KDK66_05820, partial [Deltaproteobacteria bacterium]|nr:hypothetical protein [Deltaproteobacteria bacterium]